MSTPRVSVVMTTYNGDRFLSEAIESILNQSFVDLELIIVDDGSTDSSASIIRSFCARDSRVRGIFLEKNLGIPKAANCGLREAKGEYVARMDSDDLCHRDRLFKQVSYLDKYREVQVVGCGFHDIDEKGFFCSEAYARNFRQPIVISFGRHRVAKDVFLCRYPVIHATIVCRRSCLISLEGYREIFLIGEDIDLFLRLVILHGSVLDNLSEKLYYIRHYGHSITVRFSRSVHLLIACVTTLSSEFRRRGFWDPLDKHPSTNSKSLRFRGISSFLFLQNSVVFLLHKSYNRRERLYDLLHIVIILRCFRLKNFRHISLWNNFDLAMNKQIYFYMSFCFACFRLKKYRAGFLYLCYVLNLHDCSLFFAIFKISNQISNNHLRSLRSLIFTKHFYHGLKHLISAFLLSPFRTTKFFVVRSYVHLVRFLCFLLCKLRG